MKFIKGLVGAIVVVAVVLSGGSARADDYVYGSSSGLNSVPAESPPTNGDYLQLNYPTGTQYAPLGKSTYTLPNQLLPTIIADSGWFTDSTESGPGIDTYVTGNDSNVASGHLRSFLSFDTAGLPAEVISASLVLDTYTVLTPGTETVDFLGGVNDIDGNGSSDSTADANYVLASEQNSSPIPTDIATIYSALGTGPLYGSYGYTTANSDTQVSVELNSSFLSDINSSLASENSLFTVGLDDVGSIPEPGSFALIAIAAPIVLRRRRHTS
jgi:hypothetical protein